MEKEKICQFKTIRVNIPQKMLIKLFYCNRFLTHKETRKISQKLALIDKEINKLLHVRSIVERIFLKKPQNTQG